MEKNPDFATDNNVGRKTPENVPDTNVVKINGRTPDEIITGMECCSGKYSCEKCPYDPPKNDDDLCGGQPLNDAIALVYYLKDRCERLEYTLLGVMHSVDKWLDVEPYDFDKDDGTVAATRASNAREVALKAIEKAQADLAQVERERDAMHRDMKLYSRCKACKKFADGQDCPVHTECTYGGKALFEWRGPCPENTKEEGQ